MTDGPETKAEVTGEKPRGFIASILIAILRDLAKFVIAFAVGTGAAAIACWYYEVPLVFSLAGGILVLGLALAISTDSVFS